jgi:hypothetical protein
VQPHGAIYAPRPMATLVLEFDDLGGGGLLRTLREYGHRLRVVRPGRGDAMPPDLDDLQALVLCGTPADPTEAPVGLAPLVEEAVSRDLPVIATGGAALLLTSLLGGTLDGGARFGWQPVKLNAVGRDDAVLAGVAWTSEQWCNLDRGVAALPAGARALSTFGSESGAPVAAWAKGLRTYAFLYRPELDLRMAHALAMGRPDAASIERDTAEHLPTAERLAKRVFESIALFVAPLDRANKGLVKDLHY